MFYENLAAMKFVFFFNRQDICHKISLYHRFVCFQRYPWTLAIFLVALKETFPSSPTVSLAVSSAVRGISQLD